MQIFDRVLAHTYQKVRLVGEGFNDIVSASEALKRAEEVGMDLVLVSTKTNPPVVKVDDFKKILYEQKKSKAKQHHSGGDLKEIQLKVNICEHDLNVKIASIDKFLKRGDKVKVIVKLKGRERENPERAKVLLDKIIALVPCKVTQLSGISTGVMLEPNKP